MDQIEEQMIPTCSDNTQVVLDGPHKVESDC